MVKEKTQKIKPKYSIWQNVCFMVRTAWNTHKRVLLMCVVIAAIQVALNLAQLYVTPEILEKVEQRSSIGELLLTIGIFSAALFLLQGAKAYCTEIRLPAEADVRLAIIRKMTRKTAETSYPNVHDPKILKLAEQTEQATSTNSDAAEHIWRTLTELLTNMVGFIAYLFLLSNLNVFLILLVAVTSMTLLRNGIAYVYLIWQTLEQGLPASEFLLYFTAVSGFTVWVTGILSEFSQLHKESIGLSKVQEYLNIPEPFKFEDGIQPPVADGYELKLEKVSFRYPGTEKNILENINLTIHPGEKLAVVGLNSAGKTTMVMLLCGFYDPTEGRVLLNGIDIREFNRRQYYELFSAVFQGFSIQDTTIAECVAQTATDIDMDKVTDCLDKAGLTTAIAKFPDDVKTHFGREVYLDGVMLSGGQTQRLMLARALYKDGPILVLDEPTAALDPIAENDIYMKYSEMTAGKTSLFISHRLASTRFCDRIIFVADGGIAEEGTHEELLAKNGAYANLFEVQSRYYRKGGESDEEEN